MAVPEKILAIDRPPGTIVQDSGHNGPRRYAVRERKGHVYHPGKGSAPINGKVIGHIYQGEFVPILSPELKSVPTWLPYGVSTLVKDVTGDLLWDLLKYYEIEVVNTIMALVTARVKDPGIPLKTVSISFKNSFSRLYWPGAAVSPNSLSKLLEILGMDAISRQSFFRTRVERVAKDAHIVIDGTLKEDTSRVNDLSNFSYKSYEGEKMILLLYAYDVEKNEPICSEVFPGNCTDACAFAAFIEHNGLDHGLIITDKGFHISKVLSLLEKRPNLHYLTPLKRNSIEIIELHLHEYQGILSTVSQHGVFYKKVEDGGKFYYAFQDSARAGKDWVSWVDHHPNEEGEVIAEFNEALGSFGTIEFVSDLDMTPEQAFRSYKGRWLIELAFKYYKSGLGLTCTRVQSNFSVQGNEFINFLCTVASCRIVNRAAMAGLLYKMSYKEIVEKLDQVQRKTAAPLDVKPAEDDGYWYNVKAPGFKVLKELGMCTSKEEEKKVVLKQANKRPVGRPRKHVSDPDAPKRPRGRPRKNSAV